MALPGVFTQFAEIIIYIYPLKLVRQIALDNFAALKENPYTFSLASYRALSFIK